MWFQYDAESYYEPCFLCGFVTSVVTFYINFKGWKVNHCDDPSNWKMQMYFVRFLTE